MIRTLPFLTYSHARSAGFAIQGHLLNGASRIFFGFGAQPDENALPESVDLKSQLRVLSELSELLRRDATHISEGVYPATVLLPENPLEHFGRIPKIIWDGIKINRRRKLGRTTEFSRAARELAEELPRYYRRNFHFQSDGYLSETSAELYEHEVEILFKGSADAMRRLIIPALRSKFGSSDGKGLTFLEVAAGTCRSTRFVAQAFPKARIVATDLSTPYLMKAKERLSRSFPRIDFLQAAAEELPFQNGHFDAVYSVFLFHELPMETRRAVLREAHRVLKPQGACALVDSIQLGDKPEFDAMLPGFPKEFHEPFYRNYIENQMAPLLREAGFDAIGCEAGFFSKAVWGSRS